MRLMLINFIEICESFLYRYYGVNSFGFLNVHFFENAAKSARFAFGYSVYAK